MKFPNWLRFYGDKEYRDRLCPSESVEQITFFAELRRNHPDIGNIALHIRNEGARSYYQARLQKAEGMVSGAADIVIPGDPAFVCELKRRDHTLCRWQKAQLDFLKTAHERGAFVCVALGWEAAYDAVEDWLKCTTAI